MSDDPASATGDSVSAANAGTTPSTSGSGSGGADTSTSSTAATDRRRRLPLRRRAAGCSLVDRRRARRLGEDRLVRRRRHRRRRCHVEANFVRDEPEISGTSGADTFTLDGSLLSSGIAIAFDGGGRRGRAERAQADVSWHVDGAGGGAVGGVTFVGFEHLVGAAGNKDTFDVGPGGSVATVDGGDGGFDTLIVDGAGGAVASAVTGAQSWSHLARRHDDRVHRSRAGHASRNAATIEVNVITSDEHIDIEDDGVAGNGVMRVRLTTGETQTITNARAR